MDKGLKAIQDSYFGIGAAQVGQLVEPLYFLVRYGFRDALTEHGVLECVVRQ